MPGAALVATQLTDRTSRAYVLTINGVDMNVTGQTSPSWRVPIETIDLEEEGPPGISGLSLTIWDPSLQVTLLEMAPVFFYSVTEGRTLFRGFVDSWSATTQSVGRAFAVKCIGIEAVLDWMIMPADVTITAGVKIMAAIQSLYNMATGIGVPLSARADDAVGTQQGGGNAAFTIGSFDAGTGSGQATDRDIVVSAGETLRSAIQKAIAATDADSTASRGAVPGNAPIGFTTVDFDTGLRAWPEYNLPSDWVGLTVSDTTAAANAAAVLDHETDSGAVPRQVIVSDGGTPANVTIVTDGTGLPGPTADLTDSKLTTAALRQAAGAAFLAQYFISTRGRLTRAAYVPSGNVHTGRKLTLTNTQLGLSSATYVITSIRKTFIGDKQEWTIAYGSRPPNPLGQLRRIAALRATVQR